MITRSIALGLALLVSASCSQEQANFGAEKDNLIMEFPASDQALGTGADGSFIFQMSGTIHNVSEEGAKLPDLRVVGRDGRQRLIFETNIALEASDLNAGRSLAVEKAIKVPADAKIFDIGWARDEAPG